MICLRCGHCCKNYMVMIVDDPDKGISDDNIICHPGDGTPCKHLEGDEIGKYSCKIHDKKWYKKTPCFRHGQIEKGNTECRLGRYIIERRKNEKTHVRRSKKS